MQFKYVMLYNIRITFLVAIMRKTPLSVLKKIGMTKMFAYICMQLQQNEPTYKSVLLFRKIWQWIVYLLFWGVYCYLSWNCSLKNIGNSFSESLETAPFFLLSNNSNILRRYVNTVFFNMPILWFKTNCISASSIDKSSKIIFDSAPKMQFKYLNPAFLGIFFPVALTT